LNHANSFLFLIIQTQGQKEIFKIVQDFLCIQNGLAATFHWGKMWFLDPEIFEKIFGRYQATFKKWLKIRDSLDPHDQFWNPQFNL
jgi:D-arabinono-1,4-lactone oxidase